MKRDYQEIIDVSQESEGELVSLTIDFFSERKDCKLARTCYFYFTIKKLFEHLPDKMFDMALNSLKDMVDNPSMNTDIGNWYKLGDEIFIDRPVNDKQVEMFVDFCVLLNIYLKLYGNDEPFSVIKCLHAVFKFYSNADIVNREVYLVNFILRGKLHDKIYM